MRGYQGEKGDVRALPMKKWFNTNYHYIVPKFEKTTEVKLAGHKIFDEYQEAKNWVLIHVQLWLDHSLSFNCLTLKMV
ncbi:MAG: hypothetical protein ACLS5G_02240 [Streptococcus sp.]